MLHDAKAVCAAVALGANVHAEEEWALRYACKSGDTDTVQALLQLRGVARVNVHAKAEWAFEAAYMHCCTGVVQLLMAQRGERSVADRAVRYRVHARTQRRALRWRRRRSVALLLGFYM